METETKRPFAEEEGIAKIVVTMKEVGGCGTYLLWFNTLSQQPKTHWFSATQLLSKSVRFACVCVCVDTQKPFTRMDSRGGCTLNGLHSHAA